MDKNTSELVQRLRKRAETWASLPSDAKDIIDAADCIERLVKLLAAEEKRIMNREYGGDPAPFAPGGPRD